MKKIRESALCAYVKATTRVKTLRESGQGTTEYAILVGIRCLLGADADNRIRVEHPVQ